MVAKRSKRVKDLRVKGTTARQGRSVRGGKGKHAFEIKDFSFGVENPTTIGSATGGAGTGKISFNEFNIKKP
jgi:hypothetical protein